MNDQAWDQMWDLVWDQVWEQVWAQRGYRKWDQERMPAWSFIGVQTSNLADLGRYL